MCGFYLGAGSGFQSIPLAELDFQLIAIDVSREPLDELRHRAGGLSIVAIQDDLSAFARHCLSQAELIVCMDDTLTHLDALQEVRRLRTQEKIWSASLQCEAMPIGFLPAFSNMKKDTSKYMIWSTNSARINGVCIKAITESFAFRRTGFAGRSKKSDWASTTWMSKTV
jgi:hypothetical protein